MLICVVQRRPDQCRHGTVNHNEVLVAVRLYASYLHSKATRADTALPATFRQLLLSKNSSATWFRSWRVRVHNWACVTWIGVHDDAKSMVLHRKSPHRVDKSAARGDHGAAWLQDEPQARRRHQVAHGVNEVLRRRELVTPARADSDIRCGASYPALPQMGHSGSSDPPVCWAAETCCFRMHPPSGPHQQQAAVQNPHPTDPCM